MKKFEITIPKPCHENWDAMNPEEKGRYCGSCQKTVIDFTNMSDRELALFFKKPAANLCGRFHADQLDRTLEVPRKRIPWLKYFFTISLPAFLLSLKGNAQRESMMGKPVMQKEKPMGDTVVVTGLKPRKSIFLTGGVTTIKAEDLKLKPSCNTSLVPKESVDTMPTAKDSTAPPYPESFNQMLGEIMIVDPKVTKQKEIPVMPMHKKDSAFTAFTVYPNPLASGSQFTIGTSLLESGVYDLQVLTGGGEVVQNLSVVIDKKVRHLPVKLSFIAAGPYFVRLTSKHTNKSYSEIIIVQ